MKLQLWDAYERKAVVAPAILILLPYAVLHYYYLNPALDGFEHVFDVLRTLTKVALPFIFFYFVTSVARLIGKGVFERLYFKKSLYLPTTDFLLYANKELSKSYKKAIRIKIEGLYPIKLLSESKEAADEAEARRTIVDAVGYIKNQVRDSFLLKRHLIQYGFWRNLVGGSVIGLLISAGNLILFKYVEPQPAAWWLSCFMAVGYAALLISSKWAIDYLGRLYARRLFEEFMSPQMQGQNA